MKGQIVCIRAMYEQLREKVRTYRFIGSNYPFSSRFSIADLPVFDFQVVRIAEH